MLTKNNILKVLDVFFDDPDRKFHIRELARIAKMSPPGIIKITGKLEKWGLLTVEKNGLTTDLSASKTDAFFHLKRSVNLYKVYESGVVDFLKKNYEEPEAIVLFGSYSRGEDTSRSDIDIAVITNKKTGSDMSKFEKILKRKISIHAVKINLAEKDFINTLSNGIVLSGYLKVL